MTTKEAYERLELPEGTDLQVVRKKFAELFNNFQAHIDNAPTSRLRQALEQEQQELAEAYTLLIEGDNLNETPDIAQALVLFRLNEGHSATHIRQTMQQHIQGLEKQRNTIDLPEARQVYDRAIAQAISAKTVVSSWLNVREQTGTPSSAQAHQAAQAETTTTTVPGKNRNILWYLLGTCIVLLAGILIGKLSVNNASSLPSSETITTNWETTHYISLQLGQDTLTLYHTELSADERQQIANDPDLHRSTYATSLTGGDSIAIVDETDEYYIVSSKNVPDEWYYLYKGDHTKGLIRKLGEPENKVVTIEPQVTQQTSKQPAPPVVATPKETPEEMTERASVLLKEGYIDEARSLYQQAGRQGHADAYYRLGNTYFNIEGTHNEAIKWYRLAADMGHASACWFMGFLLEDGGYLVEADCEAALEWYHKALAAGSNLAYSSIGSFYEFGCGSFAKDETTAMSWYQKGAEIGNPACMDSLARMLLDDRQQEQAIHWLKRLANGDSRYASQAKSKLSELGVNH